MKYAGILLLAACVLVFSGESSSATNNAETIARRVEKTLNKVETLHCAFERTFFMKSVDRTTGFSGTIHVKKPYLLRVEYPAQTIVVDGKAVWVYVPGNKQVRISHFLQDEENFTTPQSIFERYLKDREIAYTGDEEINGYMCDVLELVSDNPEEANVRVWIDRNLHIPVKTIETFGSGDIVQFVLKDVVLNEKIEDEIFTFVVPEGVETIDLRE